MRLSAAQLAMKSSGARPDDAPDTAPSGERVAPTASLAGILLKRPLATPLSAAALDRVPRDDDPAVIIAWWEGLKRGRSFPAPDDLDRAAIGARWSAAVLLSYSAEANGVVRATRIGDRDDVQGGVEYSPMLTEWLLALGRRTMLRGAPVDETRDFPSSRGTAAYRIVALPLSAGGHGPDHVLCRLGRA
jgi:hypothetical protein